LTVLALLAAGAAWRDRELRLPKPARRRKDNGSAQARFMVAPWERLAERMIAGVGS
jgi:hypothetical protein